MIPGASFWKQALQPTLGFYFAKYRPVWFASPSFDKGWIRSLTAVGHLLSDSSLPAQRQRAATSCLPLFSAILLTGGSFPKTDVTQIRMAQSTLRSVILRKVGRTERKSSASPEFSVKNNPVSCSTKRSAF